MNLVDRYLASTTVSTSLLTLLGIAAFTLFNLETEAVVKAKAEGSDDVVLKPGFPDPAGVDILGINLSQKEVIEGQCFIIDVSPRSDLSCIRQLKLLRHSR